jgi:hypothetical protein
VALRIGAGAPARERSHILPRISTSGAGDFVQILTIESIMWKKKG